MNSNTFFIVGLVFLAIRVIRWLLLGFDIVDELPGPASSGYYQISLLFILSSIYLRIDEYVKSKS